MFDLTHFNVRINDFMVFLCNSMQVYWFNPLSILVMNTWRLVEQGKWQSIFHFEVTSVNDKPMVKMRLGDGIRIMIGVWDFRMEKGLGLTLVKVDQKVNS